MPTERVWELLARGVLAGAPEGETGMRVFLQPRPAPAPVTPVTDDAGILGPTGQSASCRRSASCSPSSET